MDEELNLERLLPAVEWLSAADQHTGSLSTGTSATATRSVSAIPLSRTAAATGNGPQLAVVLAALEWAGDQRAEQPRTKREVLLENRRNNAYQVHLHKGVNAHRATRYEQWYASSRPYEVRYDYLWEPYVMVLRESCPLFDERFIGYGNDKASHTYELQAAGFRFVVAPQPFLIHQDHGVPAWRKDQGSGDAWQRWAQFANDVAARYGGFVEPIPEWLKQACLNGDCPPFWQWIRSSS